jgi:DNA-binding XRE family transcriptional regulator
MDVQVISRDGEPEYAVIPWERYQLLLAAAGMPLAEPESAPAGPAAGAAPALPVFNSLRALREGKAVALESLARAVGISPSYLAMIESGEREPDAAIRRSLAWELGVPGWEEGS